MDLVDVVAVLTARPFSDSATGNIWQREVWAGVNGCLPLQQGDFFVKTALSW
ncbi:MAG: hypothetical protein RBJ76_20300 [Stenomitos frigidus ULC029]